MFFFFKIETPTHTFVSAPKSANIIIIYESISIKFRTGVTFACSANLIVC